MAKPRSTKPSAVLTGESTKKGAKTSGELSKTVSRDTAKKGSRTSTATFSSSDLSASDSINESVASSRAKSSARGSARSRGGKAADKNKLGILEILLDSSMGDGGTSGGDSTQLSDADGTPNGFKLRGSARSGGTPSPAKGTVDDEDVITASVQRAAKLGKSLKVVRTTPDTVIENILAVVSRTKKGLGTTLAVQVKGRSTSTTPSRAGDPESDQAPIAQVVEKHLKELSAKFGPKNAQVYRQLVSLIKTICGSAEKIFSNHLSPDQAFAHLEKDVASLAASLLNVKSKPGGPKPEEKSKKFWKSDKSEKAEPKVDKAVENEVMNVLYEKLVLVIIYTCKNKTDARVISNVARLVYLLTNEVFDRIVCSNHPDSKDSKDAKDAKESQDAKTDGAPPKQNKLLLHMWDILLVLIFCKEKKLKLNFMLFLETFVRSACVDEVVINTNLYKKHVKALLTVMTDGQTQVFTTSMKLLQSFQAPEVLNVFVRNLNHQDDEVRLVAAQIIDVPSLDVLEYLVAKLRDPSPKVRSAVFLKLGSVLTSIPVPHLLYALTRGLAEASSAAKKQSPEDFDNPGKKNVHNEVALGFFGAITAWIDELGLVGLADYLMGVTLQMDLVVSVLAKYFEHLSNKAGEALNLPFNAEPADAPAAGAPAPPPESVEAGGSDKLYNELVTNKDNMLLLCVNCKLTGFMDFGLLLSGLRGVLDELKSSMLDTGVPAPQDSDAKDKDKMDTADKADSKGVSWEHDVDGAGKGGHKTDQKTSKNKTDQKTDKKDPKRLYALVNRTNLVLTMLSKYVAAHSLDDSFSQNDEGVSTKIGVQNCLKKLIAVLPTKFVAVTLIDEYVRLTSIDADHALNSAYLVTNNPVGHALGLLNHLDDASPVSPSSLSLAGPKRGNKLLAKPVSAELVLETLKDIYDPFELNDIKNVFIVINELEGVTPEQIEAFNFSNYSLDHLTQFAAQLQAKLKLHQEHQAELVGLGDAGGRDKRSKLDEELRRSQSLIAKQERLLRKITTEITTRHLHILVIIYVYLNHAGPANNLGQLGLTGPDGVSGGISSVFNIYIIPILNSFSSGAQAPDEPSGGRKGGADGAAEFYNNILVLMCLCVYNIVTYPALPSGGDRLAGPELAAKQAEKNAALYKELGIYHVLLENLVTMLDVPLDAATRGSARVGAKRAPSSIATVNAANSTLPRRPNDMYTYKLEIVLKIVVDLLYLLHLNGALACSDAPPRAARAKAKRAPAADSEACQLVEAVFLKILDLLSGRLRVNAYLHSVVVKLLVKVVPMVGSALLRDYVVCMLELLLFLPPYSSSDDLDEADIGFNATDNGGDKTNDPDSESDLDPEKLPTREIGLGDLDRLILFNVFSNLYNRKTELVNQCIEQVICSSFRYLFGVDGCAKDDVLCRFKFFFIYLFTVHSRSEKVSKGGEKGDGGDPNAETDPNNPNAEPTDPNNPNAETEPTKDPPKEPVSMRSKCRSHLYHHLATMFEVLCGAKYVNVNDLLVLVQYLLNVDCGGDAAQPPDAGAARLLAALKRYFEENLKYLSKNKLSKLVLDNLAYSTTPDNPFVKAEPKGGAKPEQPSGSPFAATISGEPRPFSRFLLVPGASKPTAKPASKTPTRPAKRARRRYDSDESSEDLYDSDETETSETSEPTEDESGSEDSADQ